MPLVTLVRIAQYEMLWFLAGFVVALLTAVPAVVLFLRKGAHTKNEARQRAVLVPDKNEHLKQLEELGKLTGELAHEIKNPLSIIKINLRLTAEELKRSNAGELGRQDDQRFTRALRKIAVIEKEAGRLEQILDDFLRYADRGELQLVSVDINLLVSDMIDFYSPLSYSHSITIREGLYAGPLVCKVDADMLKQVILNLFINAQQAMSDGGELIIRTDRQKETPSAKNSGREPKEDAVIQISDTGSGIAPDKLAHIFDAYYSSRPQGSGLGLPTAKRIVEAHNGTINVDSEQGKGTSFTIKLPLVANGDSSEVSV